MFHHIIQNYMKSIIWNSSTNLSILQLEHRQVCIAQTRLQAHKDDPWKDTTEDSLIGITLGSFWLRGSRANVVVKTYMLKGKGCWIYKHEYRLVSHIKWFFFLKTFIKGKKQFIRELLQTLISLSLEEIFQIFIHFIFCFFLKSNYLKKKKCKQIFLLNPSYYSRESQIEFKIVNLND